MALEKMPTFSTPAGGGAAPYKPRNKRPKKVGPMSPGGNAPRPRKPAIPAPRSAPGLNVMGSAKSSNRKLFAKGAANARAAAKYAARASRRDSDKDGM